MFRGFGFGHPRDVVLFLVVGVVVVLLPYVKNRGVRRRKSRRKGRHFGH